MALIIIVIYLWIKSNVLVKIHFFSKYLNTVICLDRLTAVLNDHQNKDTGGESKAMPDSLLFAAKQ